MPPVKRPPRELGLPARPLDRDRPRAVLHQIAGRNDELHAEVGMGEAAPVDHALGRVVVDHHSFKLGQEGIAIAQALARRGRSGAQAGSPGPSDSR